MMRAIRPLLFVVALLHGGLYALLMPPWQAPDEVAHFVYARVTADLGRLPTRADVPPELDTALLASLVKHRAWEYRSEPVPQPLPPSLAYTGFSYDLIIVRQSLGYLPYAAAVWPVRTASLETQLYVMRLASVLMGAVIVLLTFQLGRLAQPGRPEVAVAAAAVVLLVPQHAFINASVTDGNPAALAVTIVLFLLVRMARRGFTWPQAAGVALAAAYAILSKATTYFLIPLLVLTGPWLVWRQWSLARSRLRSWNPLAVTGVAALVVAAVAVPVALALPRLDYVRQMLRAGAGFWADAGKHSSWLMDDGRLTHALADTFRTFWGNFGWVIVWLPANWYTLLFALTSLALLGLALRAWPAWRSDPDTRQVHGLLTAAVICALTVLVAWFVASPDGLSYYQGRYLFTVMAPIAVLLAAGWRALLPARGRALTPALVLLALGTLDAAALFGVAIPYFYGL